MPGGGGTARPRDDLLSDAELAAVLPALPGWTGDTGRLLLDVVVRDPDALLADVAAVEAELDHHARVERTGPALTFTLWTHVHGAVTAADLELADQISRLVARHAR